ncbi:MAG: restriction endonuclease subunit S [Bacteroides thetaiotaomicron]
MRFPEFSGEWEEHTLSEYLEFKNGLNPDAKRIGSGLPFISVMDILSEGVINYDNIRGKVNATEKEIECFGVKDGDLLFQRSSETLEDVGRANVYMDNRTAIYGGFVIRGRKIGNYDPLFFKYLLATPLARKRTCRMGAGAQHFNIGQEGLSKISLYFPSIEEQRKIAEFLSLIDERIATQNKIIEDLKKLKSAIIEKLYSKIQGKEYSYGQLFEVINERNKQMEYSNILAASQEKGMVNRNDLNLDIQFERSNIDIYKIVRKGDYVIHLRSFQGGFAFSNMTGVCSPAYTILRPSTLLEYGYLSYYFKSYRFIKSLIIVTYGIRDGRSISVEEWLNLKISIPSKEHQLHILKVLRSFDLKIENEEAYASCLSNQKQYLLRQMFI